MSGFNFGQTSASSGGFAFGATPNTTAGAFGTPSTQQQPAAPTGGFAFGTPSTQQQQPAAPTGGFAFGTPSTQQQQPAAPTATGGFGFGGTTATAPTATGGGFAFGTPAASQPAPQQQTTAGFAFAIKPTSAALQPSNTTPGFAQPATQQQTTSNFAFAIKPTSSSSQSSYTTPGFALSGGTQPTGGGLNLTTNKPPATGPTGFNFGIGGATQVSQQNVPGSLSLGTATTATAKPPSALAGLLGATTAASTTSGGTTLFASPGYNLGGTTASTTAGQTISLGGGLKPLVGPPLTATAAPTLTLGVVRTSAPTLSVGGAPAPSGFKLGGTNLGGTSTATNLAGTTVTSSITGPGTFGLATTTSGASLSTVTNTTASTATPQAINYRQLEEQINKWSLELEDQEKIFIQQATQVNAWDRLLIDNGDKIAQLNTDVEKVKLDQQHLDQELDFISAQQKELEELLIPLEQAVEQIPPIHYQQHADLEREHTYKLAENIDAQLKRMVQDLKEIIDHINTSNSTQDNNDPVQQIAKVLNAHMDSLQWIDQNTVLLQRRVDEVTKVSEQRKKEQERNFRLAYD